MDTTLNKFKAEMEAIAGEWNGDGSGVQEDNANTAQDIITKIDEISELLSDLNQ